MIFEDYEKIVNGNTEVEVLIAIGQQPILVPFILQKDENLVRIFIKKFESGDDLAKDNVLLEIEELASFKYDSLAEAMGFYKSLYDGIYIGQLVTQHLVKKQVN